MSMTSFRPSASTHSTSGEPESVRRFSPIRTWRAWKTGAPSGPGRVIRRSSAATVSRSTSYSSREAVNTNPVAALSRDINCESTNVRTGGVCARTTSNPAHAASARRRQAQRITPRFTSTA